MQPKIPSIPAREPPSEGMITLINYPKALNNIYQRNSLRLDPPGSVDFAQTAWRADKINTTAAGRGVELLGRVLRVMMLSSDVLASGSML